MFGPEKAKDSRNRGNFVISTCSQVTLCCWESERKGRLAGSVVRTGRH
jgi:hypothetical protein